MGLRRSIGPVGHTCEFNGVGERFRHAPWGIFGGAPGAMGRFLLRAADGTLAQLPPKTGRLAIGDGTVVVAETPGAGGYGPPRERSGSALDVDRRSGKFTDAYILRHYGRKQTHEGQPPQPQAHPEDESCNR
jgi:N-methylhydantoinase B